MIFLVRILAAGARGISIALRLLTRFLLRVAPDYFAPVIDWPEPGGAHPVGSCDVEMSNLARMGSRRLMARLWYPANSVKGCERRGYFGDDSEIDAMARGLDGLLSAALVRRLGMIRTWSHQGAEVLEGSHLPVLVFSHGFTGYVGQNTHLCEHLASHGYLVVSLAHPEGASIVRYPDGSLKQQTKATVQRLVTPQYLMGMLSLRKALTSRDRLKLLRQVAQSPLADENRRWAGNISDAITSLSGPQSVSAVGRIMAMADWNRVGLVGMSLGGSASASAAQVDARVHVAINLDGMQQGGDLLDTPTRVPILVMHGPGALAADGTACTQYHYQSSNVADTGAVVQRWLVQDANHFDFTDMTAFGRGPVRRMLHLGRIDGARMLTVCAALVRGFIDEHLRGARPMDEPSMIAQNPCLAPIHRTTP